MKYIRTEDGIYKNKQYQVKYIVKNGEGFVNVEEKPIIKTAKTIEELCDEFVLIEYDNSKDIYQNFNGEAQHRGGDVYYNFSLEQIRTGRIKIDGPIYGAIWTDKGLIYVAKVNDKGELELL